MQHRRSRTQCRRVIHGLVVALFAIKVLVLCWNAWAIHPYASYDLKHHQERVLDGGVVPRQRAYNGPLYYLPVLPQIWAGEKDPYPLMRQLQFVNVAYIAAFYATWIFFLFPRVLVHFSNSAVASITLLSFPGFQRLAACVHPDNVLVLLSSLCFATWLWLHRSRVVTLSRSFVAGAVIGLTGLTRPFAVVPIGIFTLLLALLQFGSRVSRRGVVRAAAVCAFTAALAGSWWVVRTTALDKPMNVYVSGHDRWQAKRSGFDYSSYYRSFYLVELLRSPNRNINRAWHGKDTENPFANSFWTTLYSDTWGDHWLHFSESHTTMYKHGPSGRGHNWTRMAEEKPRAKAVLLVAALPLSVLLVVRLVSGVWFAARRALRRRAISPALVASAVFLAGFGLFVYWQVSDGLQPGRHSSIKFHYVAYTFAFALVPAFVRAFRRAWVFYAHLGLVLGVYFIALPVAMVWP